MCKKYVFEKKGVKLIKKVKIHVKTQYFCNLGLKYSKICSRRYKKCEFWDVKKVKKSVRDHIKLKFSFKFVFSEIVEKYVHFNTKKVSKKVLNLSEIK